MSRQIIVKRSLIIVACCALLACSNKKHEAVNDGDSISVETDTPGVDSASQEDTRQRDSAQDSGDTETTTTEDDTKATSDSEDDSTDWQIDDSETEGWLIVDTAVTDDTKATSDSEDDSTDWQIDDSETEGWLIVDTAVTDDTEDTSEDTLGSSDSDSDHNIPNMSYQYVQQGTVRVFDAGGESRPLLVNATIEGNIVVSGATANPLEVDSDFEWDTDDSYYSLPFILVMNPEGKELHRWTYPKGAAPEAAWVTDDNQVIWVGPLYQTIQFGSRSVDAPENGYFVARFDLTTGTPEMLFAVDADEFTEMLAVTGDGAGNIYVAGWVGDSTAIPVTAMFDHSGSTVWEVAYPSPGTFSYFTDIELIETSGTFVGVGAFDDEITIGSETYTVDYRGSDAGNMDGFLSWQKAETGAPENSMQIGSTDFNTLQSIDIAANGAFRIAGNMYDSMAFDGETIEGDKDGSAMVVEIDKSGSLNWYHVVDGNSAVKTSGIDSMNQTHVVGRIGNGSGAKSMIAALNGEGALLAMSAFETPDSSGGKGLAFDSQGTIWMTGEFRKGTMVCPNGEIVKTDYKYNGYYLIRFSLEETGH